MVAEEAVLSLPQNLAQFSTLVDIIAHLRGPSGCPWDRKQDHASLRKCLLEECYEVLEALDEADSDRLCGELGDLLMQVVFHARIAAEAEEFDLADLLSGINSKLIRRHPHVFSSLKAANADEVLANWETLKEKEREAGTSMLASVPKEMPALAYSQVIQSRVARVGFDWAEDSGVVDKLAEEIEELKQAENEKEKAAEFGDLMFTLANIARRQDIDLEAALRQTNRRFFKRFSCMEELCSNRSLSFSKLSFDEQNALWQEAKEKVE
jgi:tetrapyrrole methylase family protein/MazG family protein